MNVIKTAKPEKGRMLEDILMNNARMGAFGNGKVQFASRKAMWLPLTDEHRLVLIIVDLVHRLQRIAGHDDFCWVLAHAFIQTYLRLSPD